MLEENFRLKGKLHQYLLMCNINYLREFKIHTLQFTDKM